MVNLLLTGDIGVGKSTILMSILEKIDMSIGGYITEKILDYPRASYAARSLYDGVEKVKIANTNQILGEMEVYKDTFEKFLPLIIEKSMKDRDIIVLDELGFMENDIDKFTTTIHQLLSSNKAV